MTKPLPKYIEFAICDYGCCWYTDVFGEVDSIGMYFFKESQLVIPERAQRLFAVPVKRASADAFPVTADGEIEGFGVDVCEQWRGYIKRFYRSGFRAVRFEYE